ncbi:MAG: glycosyltransferase family 4 protein [Prolixibacteraceae bacterium]|nr:glycosyltransferase family 4 protein [Prolixibacteraceae bacterium]
MKIGFDAKRAFNNSAGLGNFSRNSINALALQFPTDKYFLFTPENKKLLYTAPDNSTEIKPDSLLWKALKNVWRSFKITRIAKEEKLDVYHGLSHELPLGIEKTGVKLVVTIHDLIYLRHPEYYPTIDRKIYDRKFRHACKVADRIHAISEQTKQDLMKYFWVSEERIAVIYQSINPVFFGQVEIARKQELRKKYQLPIKFILSVGTVEPRKNLLGLLEGMILSESFVPLVVVGKLTDYQYKVQKFIEADLNRLQVFFLSQIQDDELAVIYQMAEVMVYPSHYEGFGLPVAEAQASGCPVITSNTSSLPEAGGDAALYVDPENPEEIGKALKTLLADQALKATLIAKGKLNAQRFTAESFATQLKQLYNTVLND